MIGRETAIQKMRWTEDDWLVLGNGTVVPQEMVEAPKCADQTREEVSYQKLVRDDFDSEVLNLEYQSLRVPMDQDYISLTERPGWLRMYGRSGLASLFSQCLLARRMTEYHMTAEICMSFEPYVFKQMAGLIVMYDTENYLYLHISKDEDVGKCIALLKAENKNYEYLAGYLPIEPGKDIVMKVVL